jgi:hypothetical protein
MKTKLISLILSTLAFGTLLASSSYDEIIKGYQDSFSRLPQFTEAAQQFEHLELIEGLPHQAWNRELLKKEINEKSTFKLHDFWFYKRPLIITPEDEKELRNILSDQKTYQVFGGFKFCGGFHPDYCVKVKDKGETICFLICFGCHEVKAYSGKHELYADFSDEGYDALRELLTQYVDQRPSSTPPPFPKKQADANQSE